ncbi:MAG: hypothetical protein WAW02_12380 [Sideroxyarcus sp.]
MPWLPMYLTGIDAPTLIDLLSDDSEIAFLVTDGKKRWRAVDRLDTTNISRIGLWHIPSGSLPLLAERHGEPDSEIVNPWLGWEERRTGANPTTPYFGAGHPGVIWLNLQLQGKSNNSCCGLSSFEWIGNHYKIIGKAATTETERWWKALRRNVSKITHKVPRHSLDSSSAPEILAFPNAYSLLLAGGIADQNPF